ncbi:hypothetical protein CFP56_004104, partial [Quercus suber]
SLLLYLPLKQGQPNDVGTSIELYKITLPGKMEKDWIVEHVGFIELWAQRAEHVHNALIFEGDMQYDDDYMQWFCHITRLFITQETAYWDISVESQLRIPRMCEPNSAISPMIFVPTPSLPTPQYIPTKST